jgi:peptidoglycan/LPS O-acetylase OafA/YrhL
VRAAGLIVAPQGAVAFCLAAVLVWRGLGGADQRVVNGFGTAAWFALLGVVVVVAGSALLAGRRWGRGPAVFAELLLLPVAWYVAVGSHRPLIGTPVGVMALAALALLFSPPALRWVARRDPAVGSDNLSSGRTDPSAR